MAIEIVYVCDNVLRTAPHYDLDQSNVIRVEQVVQGLVSRPMIFCSPECASQYVSAWLATRVFLDKLAVTGVSVVGEQIDDDGMATASGDVAGEDVIETEDSDFLTGVAQPAADETAETVDADTTTSAGDVSASLDNYIPAV